MPEQTWKRLLSPQAMKSRVASMEEWWFDTTRSIHTSGNLNSPRESRVVGQVKDSYMYVPVRVTNARAAFRDLPIEDHSKYTFIDLGSGKGRSLFVASELPFGKVLGVEFVADLHQQAVDNIARYRPRRQGCRTIESVHGNAAEFEFPNQNLVVYLFNPFGPEIMRPMLRNLMRSLEQNPRHAILLLLWPEHSDIVAQTPGLQLYKQTRRHHIYQNAVQPIASK